MPKNKKERDVNFNISPKYKGVISEKDVQGCLDYLDKMLEEKRGKNWQAGFGEEEVRKIKRDNIREAAKAYFAREQVKDFLTDQLNFMSSKDNIHKDIDIKELAELKIEGPNLTEEERKFFEAYNDAFFKKYGLAEKKSLESRVASSLQSLSICKLFGYNGFTKNKEEAIQHHLKACKYDSTTAANSPYLRRELGLDKK